MQESNGQIVLDVSTVLDDVRNELASKGLAIAKDIPNPPAADTQIVLLTAPQVDQMQKLYAFAVPLTTSMSGTIFATAAAVFYTQLTNALSSASVWSIVLGVLLMTIGWVTGPWEPATALRARVRTGGKRGVGADPTAAAAASQDPSVPAA